MTTKEKAESYFNRIGEGHENAVMRQTFKSWYDSAMYSKHCAEARMDFKERLEMQ